MACDLSRLAAPYKGGVTPLDEGSVYRRDSEAHYALDCSGYHTVERTQAGRGITALAKLTLASLRLERVLERNFP
jgi:hypothetical protein